MNVHALDVRFLHTGPNTSAVMNLFTLTRYTGKSRRNGRTFYVLIWLSMSSECPCAGPHQRIKGSHHTVGATSLRTWDVPRPLTEPFTPTVTKNYWLYYGKSLVNNLPGHSVPRKVRNIRTFSVVSIHTFLWKVRKIGTEYPYVVRRPCPITVHFT